MAGAPILAGPVRLRGFADDEERRTVVLAVLSDPRVHRLLPWREELGTAIDTPDKALEWARKLERGASRLFVFEEAATGTAVGVGGFFVPDHAPHEREFGYVLAHAHWGRGFASALAPALVTAAFESSPDVHAVVAGSHPDNAPSHHILRTKAGLRRLEHREQGTGRVLFRIERGEWAARRACPANE